MDVVKTAQRFGFELFEQLGKRPARACVFVVAVVEFVKVFFGDVIVVFVGVGKAIHHRADDNFVLPNFFGHDQHLGNHRGAFRNRGHHVH